MIYIVPKKPSSFKDFENMGLGYAFEKGGGFTVVELMPGKGPDGCSGFIVCRSMFSPSYKPSEQQWFKHHDLDGVWFGWDQKPTPSQLRRPDAIKGHNVKLLDGNQWEIPVARKLARQNVLPHAADLDEEGKWIQGQVLAKFFKLDFIASDLYDRWAKSKGDTIDLPADPLNMLSDIVSFNYFVGSRELAAMQVFQFDADFIWAALRLVIDLPGLDELVKKKVLDISSTQPGEKDSTAV